MNGLITFLIGLLVGTLASFATFSGRMAALETTVSAQAIALDRAVTKLDDVAKSLAAVSAQVAELSVPPAPRGRP